MLFVGVDAHKSTSQITVMNEAGVILSRKRVNSTREGFQKALTGYNEPIKSVLEASYSWGPMYDWLDDVSEEVLLAHPLKVRAIASARIKNDRIDSEILAHLLRANLIPAAHAPSREIRALRRVLRQRMFFVQLRTMLRNRIRALLAQHSVRLPENERLFTKQGRVWLDEVILPDSDAHLLHGDCELHDSIEVQVASTDVLINKLAEQDPAAKWLISLPGIGRFLSVLIRWEADEIRRFPDAKHFVSYTGLAPSTYASSSRLVHGPLTKQGNRWLRWAFIEAVTPAVRSSPFLCDHYTKIRSRRGAKDARCSTARKLAELAYTVWSEQRCWEETRS
jgi:transposase